MGVISGTAYWASVVRPNTTFDEHGVWTIDVSNLDADAQAQLAADGLDGNIKNKGDDRGDYITVKRKVMNAKGGMNQAPEIKDAQNNTVLNTLVGNGSKVNVLYRPFDWDFAGKAGKGADLRAVQIVELVAYEGDGQEGFDKVEGGFAFDSSDAPAFA